MQDSIGIHVVWNAIAVGVLESGTKGGWRAFNGIRDAVIVAVARVRAVIIPVEIIRDTVAITASRTFAAIWLAVVVAIEIAVVGGAIAVSVVGTAGTDPHFGMVGNAIIVTIEIEVVGRAVSIGVIVSRIAVVVGIFD